jgi:hypothetical protein
MRFVDPCLEDMMTGDPFKQAHDSKMVIREKVMKATQEQAMSRSISTTREKRKPCIVTKDKL